MGECTSCLETDKEIIIESDHLRINNIEQKKEENKNEEDDFEKKYEQKIYTNETRMERYKRKTKELFDDIKESAMNNFEYIKSRFVSQNENDNKKTEKID